MFWTVIIIKIVLGILFVIMGIFLNKGKGGFFIAGYNAMNLEDKEKIDKLKLCRFMAKFLFFTAFLMIISILGTIYPNTHFNILFFVLINLAILFLLIYANTGKGFKK